MQDIISTRVYISNVEPTIKTVDMVWWDTTTHKVKRYNGNNEWEESTIDPSTLKITVADQETTVPVAINDIYEKLDSKIYTTNISANTNTNLIIGDDSSIVIPIENNTILSVKAKIIIKQQNNVLCKHISFTGINNDNVLSTSVADITTQNLIGVEPIIHIDVQELNGGFTIMVNSEEACICYTTISKSIISY